MRMIGLYLCICNVQAQVNRSQGRAGLIVAALKVFVLTPDTGLPIQYDVAMAMRLQTSLVES